MLEHGKSMKNGHVTIQGVVWEEAEWNAIATELKRRNPHKVTNYYSAFGYSLEEFEDAMEAVIKQERQRMFQSPLDFKRQLFDAFVRILTDGNKAVAKVKEGTTSVNGVVRWSPEEWEVVVLELHRLHPTMFDERLKNVRIPYIHEAVKILPVHRRRYFAALELFKQPALRTWDDLPADVKDPNKQERAIVDFTSGPVMAPPVLKSDASNAVAVAMHEAFQSHDDEHKRKGYVHWSDEEWVKVAKAMRKQNPHFNFFASSFADIDLPAVREAQRVALPFERRRSIKGKQNLREPLIRAFKMLWNELNEDVFEEKKDDVGTVTIKPVSEEIEKKPATPEPVQVAQVEPDKAFDPVAADLTARLAQAATPLVSTLMAELAKHLLPSLIPELLKGLTPVLQTALEEIKKAAKPVYVEPPTYGTQTPFQALTSMPEAFVNVRPPEEPKKPKMAVLAPPGFLKTELERAYPEYKFMWIEHGQGFRTAGEKCELFLAFNACLNQYNKDQIKTNVPREKMRYVDGGLASVKHHINVYKTVQPKP